MVRCAICVKLDVQIRDGDHVTLVYIGPWFMNLIHSGIPNYQTYDNKVFLLYSGKQISRPLLSDTKDLSASNTIVNYNDWILNTICTSDIF